MFNNINPENIAGLLGKLPSVLSLLPQCFVCVNKLRLLEKGSSSLIQTYDFRP